MSKVEFIEELREIDNAMGDRLQGLSIDGKDVDVTYRSPDTDIFSYSPPILAFYRTEPFPDRSRVIEDLTIKDNPQYNEDDELISYDERIYPEPWSILYVVRFKYEHTEDSSTFNTFMRKAFSRFNSFLIIKGRKYNVTFVSQSVPMSGYKDFGQSEEGDRSFQEQVTLRVDFVWDIYERETVTVNREINVNTNSD